VLPVDEHEARTMARRLAREEGLLAGTSTGMNVAGAIALARDLGPQHIVATVAVDSGLKYLSGDLFRIES
jgi:cysteine synthase A